MAHQDVVPVEPSTFDGWTHPPFSGFFDEENQVIWGRGASDTKSEFGGLVATPIKLILILMFLSFEPLLLFQCP